MVDPTLIYLLIICCTGWPACLFGIIYSIRFLTKGIPKPGDETFVRLVLYLFASNAIKLAGLSFEAVFLSSIQHTLASHIIVCRMFYGVKILAGVWTAAAICLLAFDSVIKSSSPYQENLKGKPYRAIWFGFGSSCILTIPWMVLVDIHSPYCSLDLKADYALEIFAQIVYFWLPLLISVSCATVSLVKSRASPTKLHHLQLAFALSYFLPSAGSNLLNLIALCWSRQNHAIGAILPWKATFAYLTHLDIILNAAIFAYIVAGRSSMKLNGANIAVRMRVRETDSKVTFSRIGDEEMWCSGSDKQDPSIEGVRWSPHQ